MEIRTERIAGRNCMLIGQGSGGPVIYWGIQKDGGAQVQDVAARLRAHEPDAPWLLAAFETECWNRDLSPWAAPSVFAGEFSGGAQKTLDWLTDAYMPMAEHMQGERHQTRMIGGYSLSGLFSLWAFYESGLFQGAASCSGSLWYPGWQVYAQRQQAREGSAVYLSLGRREERTGNRAMACVGSVTRWQHALCCESEAIRDCRLVWHPGGHFSDVSMRIAEGFAWLIQQGRGESHV